jgi:carbon storage regulator
MLVLTRKIGEQILIGDGVVVTLLAIRRGQVRLGITAPPSVPIRREELAPLETAAAGALPSGGTSPRADQRHAVAARAPRLDNRRRHDRTRAQMGGAMGGEWGR